MYAYTIQNNVFLIVQGVAMDVAPFQGHGHGSFKGIVTYFQPISVLFCEIIFYKVFVMFFQLTIFIYFLLKITI